MDGMVTLVHPSVNVTIPAMISQKNAEVTIIYDIEHNNLQIGYVSL